MTDIALVWNPATGHADFAMHGPDLLMDDGLETAVIISLFTDALAPSGAEIPDGSGDRRGYWGDMPLDPTDDTPAEPTGSLLWLYARALQTPATLTGIQQAAQTALAWMVNAGVAGSVSATASYPALGWVSLAIDLEQQGSNVQYSYAWPLS
jgi:phage gp46-like protein